MSNRFYFTWRTEVAGTKQRDQDPSQIDEYSGLSPV